jgi:hypothetical protein
MATLTINVDPETLERDELRATEQGTSVDQVLETYLAAYADRVGQPPESSTDGKLSHSPQKPKSYEHRVLSAAEREELAQSLRELWALVGAQGVRSGGITWKREDLYDREDRDGWQS